MIRKDKKKYSDGTVKTQIRVVEGYRPGPGLPPKQRTIKSFGYLEDQPNQEKFMKMVMEFDRNSRKDTMARIDVPSNAKMYSIDNRTYNYGYKFLEALYNLLEIDDFITNYKKKIAFKGTYSLEGIFKFLVLLRILSPDSKRATCQLKDGFYGMDTEFCLQDIYRALDYFADFEMPLQEYLNQRVKKLVGRDLSYAFYDVTNYFFDIDFPDEEGGLRKRGVSKEHRVDPIVQMGLFIDSKGLPVSMSLFPGNTSDCMTLRPVMEAVRSAYGLERLIVIADKGLNSTKNIDKICHNGDGYVVSQILRGKKGQRYHEALFNETGYTVNADSTYKFKLFTETYFGLDQDGHKEERQRKVLIYWDKKDADMARRKREEKLEKARKATCNKAYSIKKGVEEYTKEQIVDPETGEILENTKRVLSVNEEKAENDARFDGYFCIITSEMAYGEREIRQAYSGLWRIEESFRIMKSGLEARPVFVSTQDHIKAHFMLCFTALLIVRLLQLYMGPNVISVERISRSLNVATCNIYKGGIIHLNDVGGCLAFAKRKDKHGKEVETLAYSEDDEIATDYKKIQNTFNTNFYDIYPKQEVFNAFLKELPQSITKRK
jgi:transposase